MSKITGIGGIFFKSKDSKKLLQWYHEVLGLPQEKHGAILFEEQGLEEKTTAFTIFDQNNKYLDPSVENFMINFRVENLVELLADLKNKGVKQIGEIETYDEYGKFAWVLDPEGRKIELWEPTNETQA